MGRPLVAPTLRTPGICLRRSIRLREENRLTLLCFEIFHPRKRNVHRYNFIDAETGIDLEYGDEAAAEQACTNHENECDGDLRGDNGAADAVAGLRAGLSAAAFHEARAQIAGSGARGCERSNIDLAREVADEVRRAFPQLYDEELSALESPELETQDLKPKT